MRPIVRNYIILVVITLLSAGSTAIGQDINNYKFSGTFEPADEFASLPGNTRFSQLAFHLKGISGTRKVSFHFNRVEKEAPALKWDVKPLIDSGYELVALIPLKQMK
jgi:hypothetical protein